MQGHGHKLALIQNSHFFNNFLKILSVKNFKLEKFYCKIYLLVDRIQKPSRNGGKLKIQNQ